MHGYSIVETSKQSRCFVLLLNRRVGGSVARCQAVHIRQDIGESDPCVIPIVKVVQNRQDGIEDVSARFVDVRRNPRTCHVRSAQRVLVKDPALRVRRRRLVFEQDEDDRGQREEAVEAMMFSFEDFAFLLARGFVFFDGELGAVHVVHEDAMELLQASVLLEVSWKLRLYLLTQFSSSEEVVLDGQEKATETTGSPSRQQARGRKNYEVNSTCQSARQNKCVKLFLYINTVNLQEKFLFLPTCGCPGP